MFIYFLSDDSSEHYWIILRVSTNKSSNLNMRSILNVMWWKRKDLDIWVTER